MQSIHGRKERNVIVLNENDQPIGPNDATVKELGSFLGTLARSSTSCPLNVFDWRKLNTKEDMWKHIKEKYDISEGWKGWIFEAIQNAWRRYKAQLKKDHYKPYGNDELRMAKRPVNVPEFEFKDLLKYWNSDAAQDEMEKIQSIQESKDGSQSVDAFASAMGPAHPGRLRLYGRGVTKTILKRKVRDFGASSSATDEMMQQKMEEIEARMQQNMLEKFNAQKDAMEQEIAIKVIAQLQCLNPELRLDPNMLTFCSRSPGEADIQLINRPSIGSNVQGEKMKMEAVKN